MPLLRLQTAKPIRQTSQQLSLFPVLKKKNLYVLSVSKLQFLLPEKQKNNGKM